MRVSTAITLAVALALAAPVASRAAQEADLTQEQQQKLEALSPDVRQQVMDRLSPDETIDGVLETLIVNNVSAKYPGAEEYVPNIAEKNVDVVFKDERWLVNVDPATLEVIDAKKMETQ